jgi:hypothetical protein
MDRFLFANTLEIATFGLRPAGPLALLLAPHVPHRVRIVARASPAGLGPSSRMRTYFCANPKSFKTQSVGTRTNHQDAKKRQESLYIITDLLAG